MSSPNVCRDYNPNFPRHTRPIPTSSPAPVAVMEISNEEFMVETAKGIKKSTPALRLAAVANSLKVSSGQSRVLDEVEIYMQKRSKIVILRLPQYKEALRNLDNTQCESIPIPPTPMKIPTCFTKDSNPPESSIFISLETYVAWLLEDPDPDPPAPWQDLTEAKAPIPSQLTAFEFSGLYNTGECMDGCSGQPPGTGCPICKPVDFKDIMQLHRSNGNKY